MELNKALQCAVILAWEDLAKISKPNLARVEYRCEPGTPLDHVGVWAAEAQGQQHLVCDYWTSASLAHSSGVQFRNGYSSDQLAGALDLIMQNQGQFTRAADACRDGLALIYPPSGAERAEAASWIRGARGPHAGFGDAAD
jgi:hypothetical protein